MLLHPRRRIELVAFPGVQILDLAGPMQVFVSANDTLAQAGKAPPYATHVVAPDGLPVMASSGLQLATEALPSPDVTVDTLVIAGGPGVDAAAGNALLVEWTRGRTKTARRVTSVCTGAFLLAASGALDGRRATTHWAYCAELARRFPTIYVEPDPIFVRDDSIWTSAGVTAGIDLALALVEDDLGRDVALAVARYLVVFLKRPGGQAQFSTALSLQMADDRFGALHAWMGAHLTQDLSLQVLAGRTAMSPRSFSRHYREATGLTPMRAVEHLRLDEVRRLLLDSTLPIKRIAQRCGFGSEETLRRSFAKLLKTSPQAYRDHFGMTVATPNARMRKKSVPHCA
ncbi:MAG: GlxA family transcriptional regulator [Rhodanobacteraceae bacterium]